MSKKFIILIIAVVIVIVGLAGAILFYGGSDQNATENGTTNHNTLVLLVDDSGEHEPSIGAVDFAFVIHLQNYSITNLTPIYPTGPGMFHPTAAPVMIMNNVNVHQLFLHDTLYDTPLEKGTKNAQEIVEYQKGIKTDSVVIIKPEAVDAILTAIGGVDVNGSHITNNSKDFLRDEQYNGHISRPDIVQSVGNAMRQAASKDSSKRGAMIQAITVQYAAGNIIVVPNDFFYKMITQQGIQGLLG